MPISPLSASIQDFDKNIIREFRSGAIPVRAVFTISIMLLAVYGASVIVYVDGGLGWLGIDGLKKAGEGALCWVTPV